MGGAGSGGGGGGDVPAEDGKACRSAGRLACDAVSSVPLFCNGEEWEARESCMPARRCDRRTGTCGPIYGPCEAPGQGICFDHGRQVCGPDLTDFTEERCVFGCSENDGTCFPPVADELVVDRAPDISSGDAWWPGPLIPVCVHGLEQWSVPSSLIRDAATATWGAQGGVSFAGWGECSQGMDSSSRVELSFRTGCRGELASIDRYGYPGPNTPVSVTFCLSYHSQVEPGASEPIEVGDELLRFLARHEFGHVLGHEDDPYYPAVPQLMSDGVRLALLPSIAFEPYIGWIHERYGYKPRGSLVTSAGACLGASASGFSLEACDGSLERQWQLLGGQLRHAGTQRCVHAAAAAPAPRSVDLADCGEENPGLGWEPRRVEWRGRGNGCVTSLAASSPSLVMESCAPARAVRQTWSFTFTGERSVRIELSDLEATRRCVRAVVVPARGPFLVPLVPQLIACGTADEFYVTDDGLFSFNGYCLAELTNFNAPGRTDLVFSPCGFEFFRYAWHAFGRFENDSSEALTLTSEAGRTTLQAVVGSAGQGASQLFNYYF